MDFEQFCGGSIDGWCDMTGRAGHVGLMDDLLEGGLGVGAVIPRTHVGGDGVDDGLWEATALEFFGSPDIVIGRSGRARLPVVTELPAVVEEDSRACVVSLAVRESVLFEVGVEELLERRGGHEDVDPEAAVTASEVIVVLVGGGGRGDPDIVGKIADGVEDIHPEIGIIDEGGRGHAADGLSAVERGVVSG
jgi:hypothetical protein